MRALLLLESAVVLLLAGLILWPRGAPLQGPAGDYFPGERFLLDALPGERIRYRVDDGRAVLEYGIDIADRGNPLTGPPKFRIHRALFHAQGHPVPDPWPSYTHLPHLHGLFPLVAQDAPGALDRTWVWTRITRVTVPWRGTTLRCWRIDAIDPALPDDADVVQVWMHEDVPVYGILKWTRSGHVYEADWAPKP